MKKKSLLFFGILLISALSSTLFTSCDKDTWCYLDVTVKDIETKQPVEGAWVMIDMDGSTIRDLGQTNSSGMYSTKFAAPAIFNITSRLDYIDTVNPTLKFYRQGVKSIRLKEGETVSADVIIESDRFRGNADFTED